MAKQFFSLVETQELLPIVAPLAERLQALKRELDAEEGERARCTAEKAQGNGHTPGNSATSSSQDRVSELIQRIEDTIAEVHALGCEVKDPELGLIDFPSLRDGREVYLCWSLGEERIAHWHDLETGYLGRQPL